MLVYTRTLVPVEKIGFNFSVSHVTNDFQSCVVLFWNLSDLLRQNIRESLFTVNPHFYGQSVYTSDRKRNVVLYAIT